MRAVIGYQIIKNNIEEVLKDVEKIKQAHQNSDDVLVVQIKIIDKKAISSILSSLTQVILEGT
ncbi:hypothetical protein NHG33_06530 [Aerococcaceae bacterium NML130460]|nr:hypothetical protein [Aerococcaceae bacterium NML130460]